MKYIYTLLLLLIATQTTQAGQYTVTSPVATPVEETPISGFDMESIYLLNTFSGATISYTTTATNVSFYKYTQSAADAVKISPADITTETRRRGNNVSHTQFGR